MRKPQTGALSSTDLPSDRRPATDWADTVPVPPTTVRSVDEIWVDTVPLTRHDRRRERAHESAQPATEKPVEEC
jgi:hypothetical protein